MKTVYLNDSNLDWETTDRYYKDAAAWAKYQCPSFINYDVQDVSDVSYVFDKIALYRFNDPKDAMWFELKWRV